MRTALAKSSVRLLRFLDTNGDCLLARFGEAATKRFMVSAPNRSHVLIDETALDLLHRADLVEILESSCRLSAIGKKCVRRLAGATDEDAGGFRAQHRHLKVRDIEIDGNRQRVTVNEDESPLTRLKRRKAPDGSPWISDAAFEAGECVRRDFTIGNLMQKVTARWDTGLGSASANAGRGGMADLSDSAIDARQRLDNALRSVGPDLAGVVTDVCCFLKGLECVERERRWPPRSAKLMLRTGLELLAAHYGTRAGTGHAGKSSRRGREGYCAPIVAS